jgi:hypothetical protein
MPSYKDILAALSKLNNQEKANLLAMVQKQLAADPAATQSQPNRQNSTIDITGKTDYGLGKQSDGTFIHPGQRFDSQTGEPISAPTANKAVTPNKSDAPKPEVIKDLKQKETIALRQASTDDKPYTATKNTDGSHTVVFKPRTVYGPNGEKQVVNTTSTVSDGGLIFYADDGKREKFDIHDQNGYHELTGELSKQAYAIYDEWKAKVKELTDKYKNKKMSDEDFDQAVDNANEEVKQKLEPLIQSASQVKSESDSLAEAIRLWKKIKER